MLGEARGTYQSPAQIMVGRETSKFLESIYQVHEILGLIL